MTAYRIYLPLYERRDPTAHRLADTLADSLHVRTRSLVVALRVQHGVGQATAMKAVSIARSRARKVA